MWNVFFVVKNSLLKFVQAFCIHPVYCYSFSSFFARRKFVDVKRSFYLMLGNVFGVNWQDAHGCQVARPNKFCTATPVFVRSQYESCLMSHSIRQELYNVKCHIKIFVHNKMWDCASQFCGPHVARPAQHYDMRGEQRCYSWLRSLLTTILVEAVRLRWAQTDYWPLHCVFLLFWCS